MSNPNPDRVQNNTPRRWNERIQRQIDESIVGLPASQIPERVDELESEWSLERWIEAQAAGAALFGLALTTGLNRRFLFIPTAISSMVLLHGVQGFYPLLPLLRYLGVRTRAEIDRERYGLVQRLHPRDPEYLLRTGPVQDNLSDRVRRNTSLANNARIDRTIEASVRETAKAGIPAIRRRLDELEKEWDIERLLQANASSLALTGLLLSLRDKRWLLLPAGVFGFFMQHALQGWCPPIPLLRRLGFRTRREIDREKYALLCQL